MSENPSTLSQQLANRVKRFCLDNNFTQKKIAHELSIDQGQFSAFLGGTVNLSAERVLKLLQFLNKQPVVKPAKMIRLEHFQSMGEPMTLDSGGSWVPGDKSGGSDPVDSTDITGTNDNPARSVPDDDELEFLAGLAGLHQSIIDKINERQAMQKAKPNAAGVTSPPKKIADNTTSKTAGSRGDLFRVTDRKAHLAYLQEQRERAQAELDLAKQIEDERATLFSAQKAFKELKR
jgi:transcriptional regulator with XRE-family HTH domain